jgi:hypothetical protein
MAIVRNERGGYLAEMAVITSSDCLVSASFKHLQQGQRSGVASGLCARDDRLGLRIDPKRSWQCGSRESTSGLLLQALRRVRPTVNANHWLNAFADQFNIMPNKSLG